MSANYFLTYVFVTTQPQGPLHGQDVLSINIPVVRPTDCHAVPTKGLYPTAPTSDSLSYVHIKERIIACPVFRQARHEDQWQSLMEMSVHGACSDMLTTGLTLA